MNKKKEFEFLSMELRDYFQSKESWRPRMDIQLFNNS